MLMKEAALPEHFSTLLVEFGKVPNKFEIRHQAQRMHDADLTLGVIQRFGNVAEASRVQVERMSACTTNKRGMERQVLRDSIVNVGKAARPIDCGDHSSLA